MKNLQSFEEFLNESSQNVNLAIEKIDGLIKGKIFDDAKKIDGTFKMSKHTWNEVIVAYEKNENQHHIVTINVDDIHITQPNIQANKVKKMLDNIDKLPRINVVQFSNGEKAIYDGHHRLIAHWALGEKKIKVNLVKTKEKQIQEQLEELDEFVRVQLQDIDPNGDRFQYETYSAQIDGRRSLAGIASKWNIAIILDTSEDYDGIDLKELWPIMEGIEEYLKYQCDNIELECLIGSVRGETTQTEITEDMKDTDNWQWVGAKFNFK